MKSAHSNRSVVPEAAHLYAWAALILALGVTGLVLLLAYRPGGATNWLAGPAALLSQCATAAACLVLQRSKFPIAWPIWSGCGVLAGGIGAAAGVGIGGVLLDRELAQILQGPALLRGVLSGFLLGGCIATIWRLLASGLARERHWLADNADLEIKSLRLEREIARSELQVMQAQIEPHFLYNTLANLRQLIRIDAAGALQMTEQLIRYFKALTSSLSQPEVPLGNELTLCDAFIEIMRLRWGDQLDYAVDCGETAAQAMRTLKVPPGSLLTLVENAVKHGRPNDGSTASIRVNIETMENKLKVTVVDNGPGPLSVHGEEGHCGTGLVNLKTRLSLLYGAEANFKLDTAGGGGCVATIDIPDRKRC